MFQVKSCQSLESRERTGTLGEGRGGQRLLPPRLTHSTILTSCFTEVANLIFLNVDKCNEHCTVDYYCGW